MRAGTPQEFGMLVRERRQALHLSQAQLADRAGVSRPWLVSVEQGHTRAELGKLLLLVAELGLELDLSPRGARTLSSADRPPVDLDAVLRDHDERFGSAE